VNDPSKAFLIADYPTYPMFSKNVGPNYYIIPHIQKIVKNRVLIIKMAPRQLKKRGANLEKRAEYESDISSNYTIY